MSVPPFADQPGFNEDTTIVTALFDLGREQWRPPYHRCLAYYLRHFRKTLSLRCSMVAFVPAQLVSFVETTRRRIDPDLTHTRVVERDVDGLQRFRYLAEIERIQRSEPYRACVGAQLRPETYVGRYNVVIHSKTSLVSEAASHNPFGSRFFLWMDAGLGREKFPNRLRGARYPAENKLRAWRDGRVRLICRSRPRPQDLDVWRLCSSAVNRIAAGWWGGTAPSVIAFDRRCEAVLREMLAQGVVDNEQSVYAITYLQDPSSYVLHHGGWYAGLEDFQCAIPVGRAPHSSPPPQRGGHTMRNDPCPR